MRNSRSQPQDTAPRLPRIRAGAAVGIAMLAFAGWPTGVRLVAGRWDAHIPMAPSTALAFPHPLE